jgi:CubicO group peptidase (beta-lactamase class C family)
MAQDEGLLSINDQVISFFPEDTPEEPSKNLKAMRVRDLLKMNSGHQWGHLYAFGYPAESNW